MPAAPGIVFGQRLGTGGGMLHPEPPEPGVGAVHVAHDDGDVLEPAVVAPGVRRRRAPAGSEILGQLEPLLARA